GSKLDMQLAFGIVAGKDSDSIDLAVVSTVGGKNVINKNIADDNTTLQGIYNFSFANDCVTYTYDPYNTQTTKVKEKIQAEASPAALKNSNFTLFETEADSDVIWWKTASDADDATYASKASGNNIEDYANYAMVMVVEGEVVAVYEILR
ncbi:MAG: hypothetical protein PUE13_03915, partial [Clostridiales bacterium]|nr:hypothetical protein [Clostridiales bacterium]